MNAGRQSQKPEVVSDIVISNGAPSVTLNANVNLSPNSTDH